MAWYNVLSIFGLWNGGTPIPVDSSNRLPVDTGLTQPLTDAQLRASPVPVASKDFYTAGECLADQNGDGTAKTYAFSAPVQLVYVEVKSSGGTSQGRADPFGGTPTASAGIPCEDGAATAIPVTTSSVKVFAPSGCTVTVWGFRY